MTRKLLLLTIVLGVLLIFAIQNSDAVQVHVLVWTFSLSRALLILIPFLAGFLLGWGLNALGRSRRKAKVNRLTPYL